MDRSGGSGGTSSAQRGGMIKNVKMKLKGACVKRVDEQV